MVALAVLVNPSSCRRRLISSLLISIMTSIFNAQDPATSVNFRVQLHDVDRCRYAKNRRAVAVMGKSHVAVHGECGGHDRT